MDWAEGESAIQDRWLFVAHRETGVTLFFQDSPEVSGVEQRVCYFFVPIYRVREKSGHEHECIHDQGVGAEHVWNKRMCLCMIMCASILSKIPPLVPSDL